MSWTYTPGATPKDQVRQLITDTDSTNPIFSDEELTAQLNMESALQPGIETGDINIQTVYFAAATSLETIASSEVLIQKAIKLIDFASNGPAEAAALMKRADVLRQQASQDTGEFDWAEMVPNAFTERERVIDQALRNAI